MRIVLFVFILLCGIGYAAVHFHLLKRPSLSSLTARFTPKSTDTKKLDELMLNNANGSVHPDETSAPVAPSGKVAGISTEKLSAVGQGISEKGSALAAALSTFVTTDANSATPAGQVTIDVQKISDQIGSSMEKLPAALVNQAKVAYCQQVLQDATRSATSH